MLDNFDKFLMRLTKSAPFLRRTTALHITDVGWGGAVTDVGCRGTAVPLTGSGGPYGLVLQADTRIIRGHRLLISRYRDKLFATYRSKIAVLKIVDLFYNTRFS